MEKFDDETIIQFLRRSYATVDGLWFMKVEETHNFDEALRLDEEVWKVMAKIQARKARQLVGASENTLEGLAKCFALKFAAEDYDYQMTWPSEHELEITIERCPWYNILTHSGREAIAVAISDAICVNEYAGWVREFGNVMGVKLEKRICSGDGRCVLRFTEPGAEKGLGVGG